MGRGLQLPVLQGLPGLQRPGWVDRADVEGNTDAATQKLLCVNLTAKTTALKCLTP